MPGDVLNGVSPLFVHQYEAPEHHSYKAIVVIRKPCLFYFKVINNFSKLTTILEQRTVKNY